jgi:hypothetical protein
MTNYSVPRTIINASREELIEIFSWAQEINQRAFLGFQSINEKIVEMSSMPITKSLISYNAIIVILLSYPGTKLGFRVEV